MEFTLEDVGPEYVKQDPHVRVALEEGDKPGYFHIHATSNGLWPLEAMKILYAGLDIVAEELNDEEREELSRWLAENGD